MSKLRQLIEAANRKCEMAWKVYSYNPEKDNELVDTSKAFDCIAAAQAHKRDILEKNPNYTVEIIAEAVAKARIDIGNDDIDDAYMDVNYAISRDTNYKLKDFKKEAANIDVKNPGVLEVPDGKKVDELPQSHFEKLVDKKGYAEVIRALTNLEVWNKDKNKSLSSWASNMADKLKKKYRPESAQKSESKVNMSKLKNEIQTAVNKYFKDDKDLLEYVHIDTKKDKLGRDILEVRAELGYNDMVKLADHLDKIVTKYDRYAYFDQETSGIMTAVFESTQMNEEIDRNTLATIAKEVRSTFNNLASIKSGIGVDYSARLGELTFKIAIEVPTEKLHDKLEDERMKLQKNLRLKYKDFFEKNNLKPWGFGILIEENPRYWHSIKSNADYYFESAQKNEDTRQWHKLSNITKDDKPFIVIGKKDSSNGYYINVVSSLYDLTNFSNGIWFDLDDKAFNTKEQAYDRAKSSYPKAKIILASKKDFNNTRLRKYTNESAQKNEDVIPAIHDSLIIRYKDKHSKSDFDAIVKILKDLKKKASFVTYSDIREELEGWRYSKDDIDKIIIAIGGKLESSQINESRNYYVEVKISVPDNMNNKDVEDRLEEILDSRGFTVLDITATRK